MVVAKKIAKIIPMSWRYFQLYSRLSYILKAKNILKIYIILSTPVLFYLHKANPNSDPANAADVARDLLREDVEAAFSVDFHRSLRKRI